MTISDKKIIIAIDDETNVKIIYDHLFEEEIDNGFIDFHFFESGQTCLDFLNSVDHEKPVIILSDIKMPHMNGFELLEKIKARFRLIVIYMVSAYYTEEHIKNALKSGAEEILEKPIDIDLLKTKVSKHL